MNDQDKTKEELIQEVQELRLEYNRLKASEDANFTGLKLTEDQLTSNNSRLELAMQAANMAWWEMNLTTGKVTFDKRKAEMLGFPSEKFTHYSDFMALVHPEDLEIAMNAMRKHLNGSAGNYEVEYRISTKSDGYKWFYDIGSIVKRDTNGIPLTVTGLIIDISSRKRTEESLTASEYRYRRLFESAKDGILILEAETGMVTDVNPFLTELLGFTENQFLNKAIWEIGFFKDIIANQNKFIELQQQEYVRYDNLLLETADGRAINVEFVSNTYLVDKKKVIQCNIRDITERKLAEKALQESMERYKILTHISPVGIFNTDENGITTFVNPTWSKISGLSFENALGDGWLNAVHPDDKEKLIKGWKEAARSQTASFSDYRFIRPDGTIAWVIGQAVPEINSEGKLVGYIGTITDITERKRIEDQLHDSGALMYTLVQTIPDPIWLKDKDGVYLSCNTTFERLFGARAADIIGKTDYDFVNTEIAGFFLENDRKAMASGMPTSNEEWVTFADDGHRAFLETIKTPMYDSKGNLIGVLGIGRDLTERHKAEEALQMNRKQLNDIIEFLPDATLSIDKEKRVILWNKAIEEMTGIPAVDMIGKGDYTYSVPFFGAAIPQLMNLIFHDDKEVEKRYQNITRTGDTITAEIFCNALYNHKGAWISVKVSPRYDLSGNIIAAIESIRDITQNRQAEQELFKAKEKAEESDRLKSAFLTNMSHEIRTPMNGILGFTSLLKEPKLSGEEQQEYIRIIEKSGARMLNIINDIVDISKIESGLTSVTVSETNVNKQIEFLYTFFKPEAIQKGLEIYFKKSLPANESIIKTDKEKVYAILTNLIKNAIKFTKAGSIEIGCEKKGKSLQYFVKDTGVGINEKLKEIIFERFRQGSESHSRDYEGAGLGLSISKAYVEMLGGKIWIDSVEGKGSTVYFTIPCITESEEKIANSDDASIHEPLKEFRNLKILIAEDDETSELLIRIAVRIFSRDIFEAETGVETVEVCRNNPDIDLILMDIKMPVMDGLEATRLIRQFNTNVVIIAQTAFGLIGERERAIEAGCDEYISKPLDIPALKELIQKHFK